MHEWSHRYERLVSSSVTFMQDIKLLRLIDASRKLCALIISSLWAYLYVECFEQEKYLDVTINNSVLKFVCIDDFVITNVSWIKDAKLSRLIKIFRKFISIKSLVTSNVSLEKTLYIRRNETLSTLNNSLENTLEC
jgi:hypothetical protein